MPYLKGHKSYPGVGRPRVSIDEKQAKKLMNQMIAEKTAPLVRSALCLAMSERYVFERVKTKDGIKIVSITNQKKIEEALQFMEEGGLDPNGRYIYITTKGADMDAIDKLLSRPFGKAKESDTTLFRPE